MKTILNYKTDFTVISTTDGWEKLYHSIRKVLEVPESFDLDVTSEMIDNFLIRYRNNDDVDSNEKPFEINFLDWFIREYLSLSGPIWDKAFHFNFGGVTTTRHGSMLDLYETWNFTLLDKKSIIASLPGDWVFDHIEEVKQFMENSNKEYLFLTRLKDIFPAEVCF